MFDVQANDEWEEATGTGLELLRLQRAYMASIRQHQMLLGDLCRTLACLGDAIDSAPLSLEARDALVAGIGRHVDQARGIVATIDTALTRAAPAGSALTH